jgi:hypothetical protein
MGGAASYEDAAAAIEAAARDGDLDAAAAAAAAAAEQPRGESAGHPPASSHAAPTGIDGGGGGGGASQYRGPTAAPSALSAEERERDRPSARASPAAPLRALPAAAFSTPDGVEWRPLPCGPDAGPTTLLAAEGPWGAPALAVRRLRAWVGGARRLLSVEVCLFHTRPDISLEPAAGAGAVRVALRADASSLYGAVHYRPPTDRPAAGPLPAGPAPGEVVSQLLIIPAAGAAAAAAAAAASGGGGWAAQLSWSLGIGVAPVGPAGAYYWAPGMLAVLVPEPDDEPASESRANFHL